MTATAETTGTSALAPVAPGVLAQVTGGNWTVAKLADLLAGPAEELPAAEPFPTPAEQVTFTPALRKALSALPRLVGKVNPETRRLLEPGELTGITAERNAINEVIKPLAKRSDAIGEMVRHHMDVFAENTGQAAPRPVTRGGQEIRPATQRVAAGTAKGHYLLGQPGKPFEVPVEGFEGGWQQRYTSGKTYQSLGTLEELAAAGKITREEYLALTRSTRDLDQSKITKFIEKNPARGLEILAAITHRSAPGASLYAPRKAQQ